MKALGHESGKPLEQRVAELRVGLALREDNFAVELDELGRCAGASLKAPPVRRDKPRPAKHHARPEIL